MPTTMSMPERRRPRSHTGEDAEPPSLESLRGRALALLTRREHSRAELEERLRATGAAAEQVATAARAVFEGGGEGIEGLVHISEMAVHHVEAPEQVVNGGEELWVKIIDVDLERRRISLSIKQAAEGGTVAAEYQDAFGEHAFDEAGNYIGEPITADEPASEDAPVASEAPQVTDVSETLPEAVLETVPETVLETVPETPEAIEENPEIAPEA